MVALQSTVSHCQQNTQCSFHCRLMCLLLPTQSQVSASLSIVIATYHWSMNESGCGNVFGRVCLSVSVCLVCSNLWKLWPRLFIAGTSSEYPGQGHVSRSGSREQKTGYMITTKYTYSQFVHLGWKGRLVYYVWLCSAWAVLVLMSCRVLVPAILCHSIVC